MTASRTYKRHTSGPYLPGLGSTDDADVTSFTDTSTIRFNAEGNPPTDPFHIHIDAWKALGRPDRITVTVTAEGAAA